ncbi:MAG: AAA family ATPase, partial [Deltaproteobacteria bacterium]|nr:AAA family ATPase [Deltaproteobacteria bacterium]
DLKVAAGGFSPEQIASDPEEQKWVSLQGRRKLTEEFFVAQVIGESMNRRIPNGAWCLWRANPTGTKRGWVVLAQHRDIQDPEHGGTYTVKIYESEKVATEDGGWRHERITLKPHSFDPSFAPIVLEIDDLEEGELEIIAELVEVL